MLFQSTHEDRQGAEALAEPGEQIATSPLQRTHNHLFPLLVVVI